MCPKLWPYVSKTLALCVQNFSPVFPKLLGVVQKCDPKAASKTVPKTVSKT
jgi:hypothetical protein